MQKNVPGIYVHAFLPLLFVYYAGSLLISGADFKSLERYWLLLVIPIIVGFAPNYLGALQRKHLFQSFIAGNLAALVICTLRATYRSFQYVDGVLVFDPRIVPHAGEDFFSSAVMEGNYYFGYDFSFFLPTPTYFGICLTLAQFLAYEVYIRREGRKKWATFLSIYIFFSLGLFVLSSKAALISSICLAIFISIEQLLLSNFSWSGKIAILATVVGVSVLLVVVNPRFKLLYETVITHEKVNEKARFTDDLRLLTWDSAWEVIQNNWLIGVGEARKQDALMKVYSAKHYEFPAEREFNSHNQYLDLLIGGGIIALGLFLAGIASLFISAIRHRDRVLLGFLLLFSFNAVFENLLSRHSGVLLFAIFIALLQTTGAAPETRAKSSGG